MEREANTPRTIMEVYQALPEGTLAELINGQIIMSPSPNNQHQRVLIRIFRVLYDYINERTLGELLIAPSDVYLDAVANAVQPDIYFVAHSNPMTISNTEPNRGVPDLIIEILSPGNKSYDRLAKKNLYERFCVKEYWIVDPATDEIAVYTLQEDVYRLAGSKINSAFSVLFDYHFFF